MGYLEDSGILSSQMTEEQMYAQDELMAPERGTVSDLLHAGWRGTGQALDLTGAAAQQLGADGLGQSLRDAGSFVQKSEYAKPDPKEFFQESGRLKNAAMMGAEMVPLMVAPAVAGVAGTLAGGPAVGVASGVAATGAIFGAGTYKTSLEKIQAERPDLPIEEQEQYAWNTAMYETLPEMATTALGLVSGGWLAGSKPLIKAGIRNLVDSGVYTTEQILKGTLKGKSISEIVKVVGGNIATEGGSEIYTELAQRANDKTYGVEHEDIDLITLAIAAALPGSAMTAAGAVNGKLMIKKAKANIERGLQSTDVETRLGMIDSFSSSLAEVDPVYAETFKRDLTKKALVGPVSLETEIGEGVKETKEVDDIIDNADAIVKEAGIPLGASELRTANRSEEFKAAEAEANKETPIDPRYAKQVTPASVTEGIALEEEQRAINKGIVTEVKGYMDVATAEVPKEGTEEYDAFIKEEGRLTEALRLNDNRSKAIRSGMERVLVDTNTLAQTFDLEERAVIQSRIEKTQKQISKEVSSVKPKVAPIAKKVADSVPVAPKVKDSVEVPKSVPRETVAKAPAKAVAQKAPTKLTASTRGPAITDGMPKGYHVESQGDLWHIYKDGKYVKGESYDDLSEAKMMPTELERRLEVQKKDPRNKLKEAEELIEAPKADNYKDQLSIVEKLEEQRTRLLSTKGTPSVIQEAKVEASRLAPEIRNARKHLQTLPKPVVVESFKNKKDAMDAKELSDPSKMNEETTKKLIEVQNAGVEITPEIQLLLRKHKGTSSSFLKSLETPQQVLASGIGKGRTISFHDGSSIEYMGDKAKAEKRWLVRQGAMTKRVASEPLARKALAEGKVGELQDYEDKGKVAVDQREETPMSESSKAIADRFFKENKAEDFGATTDVGMAVSVLAKAKKLYKQDGELDVELLKKAVKAAKNSIESKSTEAKQASKAGIKSGATREVELSTEEDIVIPAKAEPKAKQEVAPVVTVEAGEALKAEYLQRHKDAMAKLQKSGITAEEFIGKKGSVLEERIKEILDKPESIFGNDEALREEEVYLSWSKNVHFKMTTEEVSAIYDRWVKPEGGNVLRAFLAIQKQFPGNSTPEIMRAKMQLKYDAQQNKENNKKYFEDTYKTADELLDGVIEHGSKEEVNLARFIKSSPKIGKLKDIIVFVDKGSYFSDKRGGQIAIGPAAILRPSLWLHEIQHAVTSQEILSNKEMLKEVQVMMKDLELNSGLTKEQLDLVHSVNGNATAFNNIPGKYEMFSEDELNVAYALVNEREFLSQAYSSKAVRDLMRATAHTGVVNKENNLWSRIKKFFSDIMRLPKEYDSVLEATLRISARLYKTDHITGVEVMDTALESRREETLDEATRTILAEKKDTNKYKVKVEDKAKQFTSTFKKLTEPISDTLMRISKPIYAKLISMEARQNQKGAEYRDGITPFLRYYEGLTESQKVRLDYGLLNSQSIVWDEMPADVRKSLETVLDDGAERSINVGLLTEKRKNYFPRRVKDIQKLSDYLMRDMDEKGPLGMALKKKADETGRSVDELSKGERNQVVTDMLSSGEIMQLPKPGSSKERTIGKVTSDLVPFYETSSSALLAHVYELNDKVSLREFVGGSGRKAKIKSLMSLNTKIDKETDPKKREVLMDSWKEKARELQDMELDLDEGIQSLIDTELSSAPAAVQTEVLSLLSARMRQRGASGIADTARNIGYAATMGNFLSAITQFGDIPIVFYRYGGWNMDTVKAVGSAFKAVAAVARGEITGKKVSTDAFVEHMDFNNALREFTSGDNWSGKGLDIIFKYSGLKYADLVGKEAAMGASFKYYQRPENAQKFLDKFEHFFPDPKGVLRKIQMGNKKDVDVQTAIFAELSDFQPISLSQQSEAYLKAGNMRMFYALKTFTLRTTSAAIREGMMDISKGGAKNIANGVRKMTAIILIYSLAGAGADELKDLLKGKTSTIEDNTLDNIMQMFFLSSYAIKQGMQKDQLLQGLISGLLPPVRYYDNLIADVAGIVSEDKEFKGKSLALVPVFGSFLQARSGAQQTSYSDQARKDILEDVKKNRKNRKGARDGGITERIRQFRKDYPGAEKITDSSVMSAYRS